MIVLQFLTQIGQPDEAIELLEEYSSNETMVVLTRAIALGQIPEHRDESIRLSESIAFGGPTIGKGFKVEAIENIATLDDLETASQIARELLSERNNSGRTDPVALPWDDLLSMWTKDEIDASELVSKHSDKLEIDSDTGKIVGRISTRDANARAHDSRGPV